MYVRMYFLKETMKGKPEIKENGCLQEMVGTRCPWSHANTAAHAAAGLVAVGHAAWRRMGQLNTLLVHGKEYSCDPH